MPDQQPVSVLYDAECGFCRWSVSKLLERDSHRLLIPVSIQSTQGQALLGSIPADQRLDSAHCVASTGEIRSGGEAFEWIASRIDGLGLAARVSQSVPWLLTAGYGLVAGNRSRFSRWMTPSRLSAADRVIAQHQGPPDPDSSEPRG